MSSPAATEPPAAPSCVVPRRAPLKVKIIDTLAAMLIRSGGMLVIVAVLGIFLFIGWVTLPLFQGATTRQVQQGSWPGMDGRAPAFIGVDEYETYAYALDPEAAALKLVSVADWQPLTNFPLAKLEGHPVTVAYRTPARDRFYIGTKDGHVLVGQLKFRPTYDASGRKITPYLEEPRLIQVSETGAAVRAIHGRFNENGPADRFAVALADGSLLTVGLPEGEDPKIEKVGGELTGAITHVVVDEEGRKLLAATDAGKLYHWYLEDSLEKPYFELAPGHAQRRITALDYVIGDNALLMGFSDGSIEQWFGVRAQADDVLRPFHKIRSFEPLPAAVTRVQPSGRDKGFVVAAADGTVRLCFTTSERTLATLNAGGEVRDLCYAPKLTSLMASTASGRATVWQVHNPHPEISWGTLFGKVWYEGHDAPKYEWQSTGGSDDFESKFSLVPLTI